MPIVYRFLRDLRLDDHAGLAEASKYGEIVPALVLDQSLKRALQSSARRAGFFCAAVSALDARLREKGSRLIVRRGEASEQLGDIARQSGAESVAWSESYDGVALREGRAATDELLAGGLRVLRVHDAPAIQAAQTTRVRATQGDGYRAFGPYFEAWIACEPASYEASASVRFFTATLANEPAPEPQEFGGRKEDSAADSEGARDHLHRFLIGCAPQYSIGANVPSEDGTSRLSAHLSFGTISARSVVRATNERCRDPFLLAEERLSLKRFLRAVAMRDFFLQLRWYHPETDSLPLQERMRDFAFASDHPALQAWLQGRVVVPFERAHVLTSRENARKLNACVSAYGSPHQTQA